MPKARPETIILRGAPNFQESTSAVALTPGYIVQFTTAALFALQSTARKAAPLRVVTEADLIGQAIETPIAAGTNVSAHFCSPGDVVQVALPASAPAIVIGDQLELSGDGTMRKLTGAATDGAARAEAVEAIDNSSGPAGTLIKVQAL